jgi:hypothetical protein
MPHGAKQFHPADLEILQVPAVMQVTHRIDLRIPDAQLNDVLMHRVL